jgi:hypothetical protein
MTAGNLFSSFFLVGGVISTLKGLFVNATQAQPQDTN